MLYRLRRDIKAFNFNRRIRRITKTRPIRIVDGPLTICSMVGNDHVLMYILGMKSFYSRLKRGKLKAIFAHTMPPALRDLLREHFDGIELVPLESLPTGACQRGGTWERLVHLLDISRDEFAIQVDADILACGTDISEVAACVEENRSFTYSDLWPFPRITTLRRIAEEGRKMDTGHITIAAETFFDRLPDCDTVKYIRGSSGFAGFAKGGFERSRLEEFHTRMDEMMGARWREWGSEQVGSNYAVANSPNPVVLPHPQYRTFSPDDSPEWQHKAKFLHFIGTTRFANGYFASKGIELMRDFAA
ncbi:MAG TPA: hypothetical protein VL993_09415 [Stellaceae bacterium]|nr:hypothetical protein [Stellaceae bacterium]